MKVLLRLFSGMVAGNALGVILCLLTVWLTEHAGGYGAMLIYPNLMIIPFVIGLVAAWVWSPLNLGLGRSALQTLFCAFLGVAGAWTVFHEGAVCLVIVFPILYVFELAGVLTGRILFRPDRSKLNLSVLPLAALLAVGEPFARSTEHGVVTDEILIQAPPEKVWPQVTSFPEISAAPKFWLFRLGLPRPMSTTSAGNFVGADRQCIFSGGAVFKETVAEIQPRSKLTFDIIESPKDPELTGHLTPERGEFELRDNHNGTTTLIGRTWYRLHVRPLWYFDWWTRHIFRAVHLRVMQNVRERAEGEK